MQRRRPRHFPLQQGRSLLGYGFRDSLRAKNSDLHGLGSSKTFGKVQYYSTVLQTCEKVVKKLFFYFSFPLPVFSVIFSFSVLSSFWHFSLLPSPAGLNRQGRVKGVRYPFSSFLLSSRVLGSVHPDPFLSYPGGGEGGGKN